jgi:hypothetical protein
MRPVRVILNDVSKKVASPPSSTLQLQWWQIAFTADVSEELLVR